MAVKCSYLVFDLAHDLIVKVLEDRFQLLTARGRGCISAGYVWIGLATFVCALTAYGSRRLSSRE